MTDLAEFLRARLDEDAAVARAAPADSIEATEGMWETKYLVLHDNAQTTVTAEMDARLAEHIARHDPARVLAEVEAKRRIVEKHGPTPPGYTWVGDDDDLMPACSVCGDMTVAFPCPTLRLVASVYDDHADYLPEWKIV